jgi:hypothetical protein
MSMAPAAAHEAGTCLWYLFVEGNATEPGSTTTTGSSNLPKGRRSTWLELRYRFACIKGARLRSKSFDPAERIAPGPIETIPPRGAGCGVGGGGSNQVQHLRDSRAAPLRQHEWVAEMDASSIWTQPGTTAMLVKAALGPD